MVCKYCDVTNEDESFITESEHWRVFLSYDQCYVGHCLIVAKRHVRDLNELNEGEIKDLCNLIKKLEQVMKDAFDATMFNVSCLMNDCYNTMNRNDSVQRTENLVFSSVKPVDPHVYFNLRPRYAKRVDLGLIFDDPEFGFHYSSSRTREVSDKIKKEIMTKIKSCL